MLNKNNSMTYRYNSTLDRHNSTAYRCNSDSYSINSTIDRCYFDTYSTNSTTDRINKEPTLRSTAHLQFAQARPQAKNCKRAALPHPKRKKKIKNLLPPRSKKDKKLDYKLTLEKAATVANKVYEKYRADKCCNKHCAIKKHSSRQTNTFP
ncbi:MAG: hypothetical protein P9M03_01840 [Candidatus Theseobacter exili]|nr:hypothetical protein [Candidatus Theseobacter exili]